MAKRDEIIKAAGYFDGYNSRGNFDVQLKAKFSNEELANALQFVAGIGKKVSLVANIEDESVKLGKFNVYSLRIDRDGNSYITFKSNIDNAFVDNFSQLMIEEAMIVYKAKVLDEE